MTLKGAVADAMIVGGFSSLVAGAWQIYHPAAFLLAGAMLLAAGLRAAR